MNGVTHDCELVRVQNSILQFEGDFNAGERRFISRAIDLANENNRQRNNLAAASLEAREVDESGVGLRRAVYGCVGLRREALSCVGLRRASLFCHCLK